MESIAFGFMNIKNIREIAEIHRWTITIPSYFGEITYLDFVYPMKDGQSIVFSVELASNEFQSMLADMEQTIERLNPETITEELLESITVLTPELYIGIYQEVETALLNAWAVWLELSLRIEKYGDLLNLPWYVWN